MAQGQEKLIHPCFTKTLYNVPTMKFYSCEKTRLHRSVNNDVMLLTNNALNVNIISNYNFTVF